MGYVKASGVKTLYQGQSFSRSIYKKGKIDIWESNEGGVYEMFDENGVTIVSENLVKSADNLSLTLQIADADTESLEGLYTIIADFTDTTDADVRIPLVEYSLTFKPKVAT